MFNLKHKLPSFFIKKPFLIVLLLVYLGILVAIYPASPLPGQATPSISLVTASPAEISPSEFPSLAPIPTPTPTREVHQVGDLIVSGNESRLIEDVKLLVDGNIIVKDSGKLTIRNTVLTVNNIYKDQYNVYLYDQATLLIEDSRLIAGYPPIQVWDIKIGEIGIRVWSSKAKVNIRNTVADFRVAADGEVIINNSRLPLIMWEPTAKVSVRNSDVFIMNFRVYGEAETIEMSDLKKNQRVPMSQFATKEGGFLTLENTLVGTFSINIFQFYGDTEKKSEKYLVVKDSEIAEIWPVFIYGSDVTIRGLGPRYFTKWTLADSMQGSGVPWNLELENTVVDKWKLDFHGKARLVNVEAHVDTWGDGSVEVIDSKVILHHSRGGHLAIRNSTITGVMRFMTWDLPSPIPVPGDYTLEFDNSNLNAELEFSHLSDFIIKGTVSILIPLEKVHWYSGSVVREYPIVAKNEDGAPLAGAAMILKDTENRQMWSGTTDQAGRAAFNLSFNKENYARGYTLTMMAHGKDISSEVGFLTNTPIVLSTKPEIVPTDTDGDGMSNTWEIQYGLDPNTNDANQDKDGDSYTNLKEYQEGTNPTLASSYPEAEEEVTPPAEGISILYLIAGIVAIGVILIGILLLLKKRRS